MDKGIVTILGFLAIAGIYRFFFGRKEEPTADTGGTIIVDGGYKPDTIRVSPGKPIRLTIIRKDTNSCLEEIIFPDYKIKEYLPLNKPVNITLSPPHLEHSSFHCTMNMFQGKIQLTT